MAEGSNGAVAGLFMLNDDAGSDDEYDYLPIPDVDEYLGSLGATGHPPGEHIFTMRSYC